MHLHLLIDLLIQLLLCLYIYVLIFSFINLIDLFVLWRSVPRQKHHLFFVWEGSPAIIDDTAWIVPPPPWWENGAEQHRGPRHPRHRGGPNNGLGGCRNQRGGPENMGVVKGSMWRVLFFWAVDLLYKGATLWGGVTFSRCVANSASNMFLYMLFDLLSFYFRFIKQILDDVALLRGVVLNLNLLLSYFWTTFELLCDALGNLLLSYFWATLGCRWNC